MPPKVEAGAGSRHGEEAEHEGDQPIAKGLDPPDEPRLCLAAAVLPHADQERARYLEETCEEHVEGRQP